MSDHLRRLFGLKESTRKDADSEAAREETSGDEHDPWAPELAPTGVPLLGGQTSVIGVAFRTTLVVVGVLLVLLAAYQLVELILVAVVATIVAAAIYQPSAALERRGLPRPLSILAVYGALLAIVAALVVFIAGPLVDEVEELIENAPQLFSDLRDQAVELIDGLAGEGSGQDVVDAIGAALAQIDLGGIVEIPLQAAGILVNVVIILFLSALFVYERDRAAGWILPLLPHEKRVPAARLGKAVFRRLGRFIHGQLLLMTVVGVAMFLGLVVLGIPFALPLALFAFLVEAIPMVGPWIAIIPAVAVAFTESPTQALLLAGWWLVVQQLESYVLTPAVMGKVQHLSPTVVLLSVLAGFELFGVVGALIAVPVVAAVSMVVEAVFRPARRQAVEKKAAAA